MSNRDQQALQRFAEARPELMYVDLDEWINQVRQMIPNVRAQLDARPQPLRGAALEHGRSLLADRFGRK